MLVCFTGLSSERPRTAFPYDLRPRVELLGAHTFGMKHVQGSKKRVTVVPRSRRERGIFHLNPSNEICH